MVLKIRTRCSRASPFSLHIFSKDSICWMLSVSKSKRLYSHTSYFTSLPSSVHRPAAGLGDPFVCSLRSGRLPVNINAIPLPIPNSSARRTSSVRCLSISLKTGSKDFSFFVNDIFSHSFLVIISAGLTDRPSGGSP